MVKCAVLISISIKLQVEKMYICLLESVNNACHILLDTGVCWSI